MKWRYLLEALKDSRSVMRQARLAIISHLKSAEKNCPICGFHGRFIGFGDPVRTGAACPKCWSLERHRLFALAARDGQILFSEKDVLNFTDDVSLRHVAKAARTYHTSNYPVANGADFAFDIQAIDLPNASYDAVICSHILEHVDDRRALSELYRILRPGGKLLFMIPIIEGWSTTYENPTILSERERHIHFGQFDHVRYYGADVRDRVSDAGFDLSEYTGSPHDCISYGLLRGEKIFIATKPN